MPGPHNMNPKSQGSSLTEQITVSSQPSSERLRASMTRKVSYAGQFTNSFYVKTGVRHNAFYFLPPLCSPDNTLDYYFNHRNNGG